MILGSSGLLEWRGRTFDRSLSRGSFQSNGSDPGVRSGLYETRASDRVCNREHHNPDHESRFQIKRAFDAARVDSAPTRHSDLLSLSPLSFRAFCRIYFVFAVQDSPSGFAYNQITRCRLPLRRLTRQTSPWMPHSQKRKQPGPHQNADTSCWQYSPLHCTSIVRGVRSRGIYSSDSKVLGASAFFVFAGAVSEDLDIIFAQQSWVITAYAVTFASFLVFWSKVCALIGSKRVFVTALLAVGVLNLVLSFLVEKYTFFIFRGLSGVAAAALVPSAYRLIGLTFPPEKLAVAYTLYGMTGSIANVTGTLIAGVIALIPRDVSTQMVDWRWFFRLIALLAYVIKSCFADTAA